MNDGAAPVEHIDPAEMQRRAAEAHVSAWVGASAGAGKTKVLTDRVLTLLLDGVVPSRILCLTFTKAAAAEMANRLGQRLSQWAVASDEELDQDLHGLTGRAPEADRRRLARRLFAEVLDSPGGIRIDTIHAFCQAVLKRFPLEADLPPHFDVADERTAAEIEAAALEDVILAAERAPDGGVARAFAAVVERAGETGVRGLARGLQVERGRIERIAELSGGREAMMVRVWHELGLEPGTTREDVLAEACRVGACDEVAVARACQAAAASGGKTNEDFVAAVAPWLDADETARPALFEAYRGAFLTEKLKVRSRIVTKNALEPGLDEKLKAEAERLERVCERLAAVEVGAATTAALRFAAAVEEAYAARKRVRSLLDYGDLILATRRLLIDPGAAWVLYKLDQGIDHVLIDEAQDTNPEQWEVVAALTAEFFAGEGAREQSRTVFAVGDPKQSIFGFQRADPRMFARMRDAFDERVSAAGGEFRRVPFDFSFRTVQGLLDTVDRTFLGTASEGVVESGDALRHVAQRGDLPGQVELWPPLAGDEDGAEIDPWEAPRNYGFARAPEIRLAHAIATRIERMIRTGERLESRDRPIRAGDVMVLVRRRTGFGLELVRELKRRGIGVAGVDRLKLDDELVVRDLLALADFLLLPDDDLSLAAVLKGPFVGFGEDELFEVAHGRTGRLWPALAKLAGERPGSAFAHAHERLAGLLCDADCLTPHALFARALGPLGGRRGIVARLGPDVGDAIEEFLALSLTHARQQTPTLQDFVHWFRAGDAEVRRELEQGGRDEVRLITVHGAKGLEAPIVFLPDTMALPPAPTVPLFWTEDENGELPLWLPGGKEGDDPIARAAREARQARELQEYRRLLYVAMTRAEDRLYVAGWHGRRDPGDECWYRLIEAALDDLAEPAPDGFDGMDDPWPGEVRRYTFGRGADPSVVKRPAVGEPAPLSPEPWMLRPAEPARKPYRPAMPSRPDVEPPVRSPLDTEDLEGIRFRRGTLIHRLLQTLPDLDAQAREAAAFRFLRAREPELGDEQATGLVAEVLGVIGDPAFAAAFAPGSRAEVPVAGHIGHDAVTGVIDRLAVRPDEVLVVDFKSNRPAPASPEAISVAYLRQLATYRTLVRRIWPDRAVRTALIWTEVPRLMPLDDVLLDRFAHDSVAGESD